MKNYHKYKRLFGAYTLIEMVVVIMVLGVLAASAVTVFQSFYKEVHYTKLEGDVNTLNRAVGTYLGFSGTLAQVTSPDEVLAKLKSQSSEVQESPGLSGSFVDPRIRGVYQDAEEAKTRDVRVYWEASAQRFVMAYTGPPGIKRFVLDDEMGEMEEEAEKRSFALEYNSEDGWIWNFEDRTLALRKEPTINVTSNVADYGASLVKTDPLVPAVPVAGSPVVTLSAPEISVPGGTYSIVDYTLTVSLQDGNPAGAAQLYYSVNYAGWQVYNGTPIDVLPNDVLRARAVPLDTAVYRTSSVARAEYLVSQETLLAPYVMASSGGFTAAQPTVSVSIANPNDPAESRIDYRINGGGWTPYVGPMSLNATDYPAGAIIEAVAVATAAHYLDSSVGSAAVGAAPPDPVNSLLDADFDTSFAATVPDWSGVNGQLYCNGLDPAQTVIYFDLDGKITGSAKIKSATLHMTRTAGSDGIFFAHGILPGTGKWWVNGITWNTAVNGLQTDGVELDAEPEDSATVSTEIPGVPGWSYRNRYDITDLVQRWADDPAANYGVALLGAPGQRIIYCSREHPGASVRPKLVVEWEPSAPTTPPAPPTTPPTTTPPPAVPSLAAPQISLPGGAYPITDFNFAVTLVDPNPAGVAQIMYSLNSSAWQTYGGTPVTVVPGDALSVWAVPVDPAVYGASSVSSESYEASPVALQAPVISPSAGGFTVAQPTVSVSISNANDPAVSGVEYRVNGGGWTDYAGAFTLNTTDFPGGATIEAMAVGIVPYYLDSGMAGASIAAGPPPNAPPFAADNGYSSIYTYSGTTPVISTTVLVNDWDPDGDPLTVVGVTDGAHGTVTIDGTGNPLFTSSPTFIDGTDSFTYTISDGRGGTATATVNIMVNARPVVANETVTTVMDTPVSGNVLANDWDYGGDPLIVEDNENPLNGSVTIGANGDFTYTPSGGFTGSDSFRYTVADDKNGRTYGFVNITVTAPPVIQDLAAPQISVAGGTYPITDFNLSVTLADPNPAGAARVMYRLNSAGWQEYNGTPVAAAPNDALEAQAVAVDTALYASSGVATADYLVSAVALLPPVISPSASGFTPAQPTVNVSIADANDPAVSEVQYRVQGGAWTPYVGAFSVSRASFPPGTAVLVESHAVPIAPHWLASPVASSSIDNSGTPPPAAFITFCGGRLKEFGVTVLEGGKIKTSHAESGVEGDVAIAPGGTWDFGDGAVTGTFYAHSGTTGNFRSADNTFGDGGTPLTAVPADLSDLKAQALTMSGQAASMTATQTFGKINSTMTINANAADGVNVIAIEEVDLSSGRILTISGDADAYVIINISKRVRMTGGSTWNIAGGLNPSRVIFNMLDSSSEFSGTGGSGSLAGGILLAPFSSTDVKLTGSSAIIANVIVGKELSMTGGSQIFANGCN